MFVFIFGLSLKQNSCHFQSPSFFELQPADKVKGAWAGAQSHLDFLAPTSVFNRTTLLVRKMHHYAPFPGSVLLKFFVRDTTATAQGHLIPCPSAKRNTPYHTIEYPASDRISFLAAHFKHWLQQVTVALWQFPSLLW